MNSEATILEIQRMSTEDGPGIRTTVFVKGCSLRCAWCHNPESIKKDPELQWVGLRCIGCGICVDTCAHDALSKSPEGIIIDRERCKGCGECAEACPGTALEMLGRTWDLPALTHELLKDRAYFEQSGGGITVSGGEATLQAPFVAALMARLKDEGVHTALDTCGQCRTADLELCLPHADLVLFDLKEMDPEKHREFTGAENARILEHARLVSRTVRETGGELWLRTPVIPEATAREENIRAIGEFIAGELGDAVTRWDLCAFNNLCGDKYARLGLDWRFAEAGLLTSATMEHLAAVARDSGVDPEIVQWSGSTRLAEEQADRTAND